MRFREIREVKKPVVTRKETKSSAENDKKFRKEMGWWFKEIRESIPAVDAGIFPHDDDDKDEQNN